MSNYLCITFRFIQPCPQFHGRGDADEPEWPPSPLRAYQALLRAAAMRSPNRTMTDKTRTALSILETIHPRIVSPSAQPTTVGYRAYVPHNHADLVATAWTRGNVDKSIANHRTEKDFRPHRIESKEDSFPAVHYLYPLEMDPDAARHILDTLRPAVRSVVALGWGIDQVVADARLFTDTDIAALAGEHWLPARRGRKRLRTHKLGSLQALETRHEKFLRRLEGGKFSPVPPLTAMDKIPYQRDSDPIPLPYVIFKLVDVNEDAFRYPHAKLMHITGMVRHVAIEEMRRSPPKFVEEPAEWVNRVVRGMRDKSTGEKHQQFSYVPLPSIGHTYSDALIRNVMIAAPMNMERGLNYLAEKLDGRVLTPEDNGRLPAGDSSDVQQHIELQKFIPQRGKFIDTLYLGSSCVWQSVTPVILPGHTDKKPEKTIKLIRTALRQSGIDVPSTFTWQAQPFFRNCLSTHKYDKDGRRAGYFRPDYLDNLTAVHIRIEFEFKVSGPLIIGAGRHQGFGVMAVRNN